MKDQLVPEIRFKEFEGKWERKKFRQILDPVSNPVEVLESKDYYQIGVRSHGKGIFHKESVTGKELGNKRVFWVVPHSIIFNIVFAWEGALAITSDEEDGKIASHRFPMYQSKGNQTSINYLKYYLGTKRGTALLKLASPGGAGRNKTLGKENFYNTKVPLSSLPEQQKIATFLTLVDRRLAAARRQEKLLSRWKRGVMQQVFAEFTVAPTHWQQFDLSKHLLESKEYVEANSNLPIYTSSRNGFIPQNEYYSNRELKNEGQYGVVPKGYFVFRHMSDDSTFKFNRNTIVDKALVSKEYPVFTSKSINSSFLLEFLNESKQFKKFAHIQKQGGTRTRLYFRKLITFRPILPPLEEQTRIATILTTIDARITAAQQKVANWEEWKRGLLQKMMV